MPRRAAAGRRLAAYLAVSALLHLVAAYLYRPGPMQDRVPAPPMQWVELARPPASPPARQPERPAIPALMPVPLPIPPARIEPPVPAALAPPSAATPFLAVPVPAAVLNHDDLLDQAGRIAREPTPAPAAYSARQQAPAGTDRPILPALDQALAKPTPGTRRYANGLTRVVTESGRVYCLQELPEYTRGGPAELPAVATNCP